MYILELFVKFSNYKKKTSMIKVRMMLLGNRI